MTNDLRAALRAEVIKAMDRLSDTEMLQLFANLIATVRGEQIVTAQHETPPALTGQRPERLPGERLSQERIEEALARIIELIEKHPDGLRSEQIRAELRMDKRLFQYAAHLGKTSDQLVQEGERRSTVYSLPVKSSTAQIEGRVVKRKKRT